MLFCCLIYILQEISNIALLLRVKVFLLGVKVIFIVSGKEKLVLHWGGIKLKAESWKFVIRD